MKKVIQIILITSFLATIVLGQDNAPKDYEMSIKKEVTQSNNSEKPVIRIELTEGMITTGIISFEILMLFLILYYWKKTKDDKKVESRSTFKNNIKAIRDEKILPVLNDKKSTERSELQNKINIKNLNGVSITRLSKKLNVAKGELFLAAKIQQLQNQIK